MFCPKCGQEKVSESLRFCARCGFKLSSVEEGLLKRLLGMATYLVLTAAAIFGWGFFRLWSELHAATISHYVPCGNYFLSIVLA